MEIATYKRQTATTSHQPSHMALHNDSLDDQPEDDDLLERVPATFSAFDRFARDWSLKEDTGPLIQGVFSVPQITELVFNECETTREFGLIMLRLITSPTIPIEVVPILRELFMPQFHREQSQLRVLIAKSFLDILPGLDEEHCREFIPSGIGNFIRICIQDHPAVFEAGQYEAELRLIDSLSGQEDSE
jgi:hypothetical protein